MEKVNHPNLLNITLEEAFEFGRLEGSKEALNEVIDLADTDPSFIRKFCEVRIKSLIEYPKTLSLKRGLN